MKEFPFDRFQQAMMRGAGFSAARNDATIQTTKHLSPATLRDVHYSIDDVEQCSAAAGLIETVPLIGDLKEQLRQSPPRTPLETFMLTSILCDLMISELNKRRFFFLEAFEAVAFEHSNYFRESVWDAFPSARLDVSEMASCLGCGRYNAAGYHAVQAAEVGLRVLARTGVRSRLRGRSRHL